MCRKLGDDWNELHRLWKLDDGIVQIFLVQKCLHNVEDWSDTGRKEKFNYDTMMLW